MAFHVRDKKTDEAVRRLARLKGTSLTETIRQAAEASYRAEKAKMPLMDRLKPLQDRFIALSRSGGLPADKAFYDDLSGDN